MFKINFRSGGAFAGYLNLTTGDTTPQSIPDASDTATDWTLNYVSGAVPGGEGDGIGPWPTTGDADFIDEEGAATTGHQATSQSAWIQLQLSGPASTGFEFWAYSGNPDGRVTEWRIDGGTPIVLGSDASAVAKLAGTTDASGDAPLIEYRQHSTSAFTAYASAAYLIPVAGPSITLNNATRAPGETLTGTATNFSAEPTSITLSDGASPDYTPTLTATASGDDWDISADIEDFAAQAKAAGEGVPIQGLIPGTITVTVE